MKKNLLKYKHSIFLYLCVIISLYVNFIFFYGQLDYPVDSSLPITRWGYTLANCILLISPFLLLKKRYCWVLFAFLFLLDILFFIPHTVYFRYYKNLIPLTSYFEFSNLTELSGVLYSYLKLSDFFYLLNTICLSLIYVFFFKKNSNELHFKKKIATFVMSVLVFCGVFFLGSVASSIKTKKPLLSKFGNSIFNQPASLSYYGVIPFWIYQIHQYHSIDKESLTQNELVLISSYIGNKKNNISAEAVHKNLIIVIVESYSTWVSNFKEGEATPFLSSLKEKESVIFIPNVLSQINHGGSGDAQLMYNTGLLPIFDNAVSSLYDNQYYPTLARALSDKTNFSSLTIVGDKAAMWNQKKMSIAYNMDSLISINELKMEEMIGGGISDKSVFKQSAQILKENINSPFYTQIITLSSHDAIHFAEMATNLHFPEYFPNHVNNYIKSIEYVDQALDIFIQKLKENGLYDNSVILIIADHPGRGSNIIKNYDPTLLSPLENENNIFIPLYIVNSGRTFEQKENQVIGQIDIYPTLLDIMGVENYYWKGLGTSIFSEKPPTFAVDKNLNVIGDTTGYTRNEIQHKIDAWTISDLIIRKKYFEAIKKDYK